MVTDVTSLTGNGLKDWLIQRVTALYFAAFVLFVFGFAVFSPQFNFLQWQALFSSLWFKIAGIMALVALTFHSWIGIWTVTTDYIKCTALRLAVQMFIVGWLSAQFLWGLLIFWGQ